MLDALSKCHGANGRVADLEEAEYWVPHPKSVKDEHHHGDEKKRKHWEERQKLHGRRTKQTKKEVRLMSFGDTLAGFLVTISL